MPQFDDIDEEILKERIALFNKIKGPRVGDWVYLSGEKEPRRFTYDWQDGLQVGSDPGDCGSFYFAGEYLSYSGGLDPTVKRETLVETTEKREGRVWFFHHDHHTAHNGVDAMVEFRVFRQK